MMNITSATLKLAPELQPAPAEKVFTTSQDLFAGDCMLERGAKLIIRSDGTANWIARVRSTDDDDEFKLSVMLLKADGSKVFPDIHVGPFHFPRLFPVEPKEIPHDNTWYDWSSGFSFPTEGYAPTAQVQFFYEC